MVEVVGDEGTRGKAQAELESFLTASRLLGLASASEPAAVRVYLLAPRAEAGTGAVPQLGAVAEETWAAVGEDGRLALPACAAAERGAARRVAENLEMLARFRNVLALDDPDPVNPLAGKIGLCLERRSPGGAWEPVEEGSPELVEGDCLALTISNRLRRPGVRLPIRPRPERPGRADLSAAGSGRDPAAWHLIHPGQARRAHVGDSARLSVRRRSGCPGTGSRHRAPQADRHPATGGPLGVAAGRNAVRPWCCSPNRRAPRRLERPDARCPDSPPPAAGAVDDGDADVPAAAPE